MGSPPRVRSRHLRVLLRTDPAGITSACAEQTAIGDTAKPKSEDHLRVCGADLRKNQPRTIWIGSPPRVRSRRHGRPAIVRLPGITSACAEQTRAPWEGRGRTRGHRRVCGADATTICAPDVVTGSPPRVRSRLPARDVEIIAKRITSACAEQTLSFCCCAACRGDHLRVCGADTFILEEEGAPVGSPPRVRSRPAPIVGVFGELGITSACAEQTNATCAP